MDDPFKERIRLDKFLSDAHKSASSTLIVGFGTNTSAGVLNIRHGRSAKQMLCWANYSGIGIEDLNSKGIARYAMPKVISLGTAMGDTPRHSQVCVTLLPFSPRLAGSPSAKMCGCQRANAAK